MLKHYAKDDLEQRMYTTTFLDTFWSTSCTEKDNIPNYCCNFNLIAQHCIDKKGLSKYIATVWFLYGLLLALAKKTIWKFTINIKDLFIVNYNKIFEYIK